MISCNWVRSRLFASIALSVAALHGGAAIGIDLDSGLVGSWTFDESAGATVADNAVSSTSTLDATLMGGAYFSPGLGMFGGALSLDGANGSYADVANLVHVPQAETYSWSAWYQIAPGVAAGTHHFVESSDYSMSGRINFDAGSHQFYVHTTTSANGQSPAYTDPYSWNHVAATYQQDGEFAIWINGVKAASATASGTLVGGTDGLHIGADRSGGRCLNGYLDDVAVWDRVLDDDEIQHIYNGGTGRPIDAAETNYYPVDSPPNLVNPGPVNIENGLVGAWDFDETDGMIADNGASADTLLDGNLFGDAHFTSGKFGNAVQFDGDGDLVAVYEEVIPDQAEQYSVAAWFRADDLSGTDRQFIFESSGSWAISVELAQNSQSVKYSTEGPNLIKDTGIVPAQGEWYHVVQTYNADGWTKIFVNGELVEEAAAVAMWGDALASTDGFNIGSYRNGDARFFTGLIDDVAVWTRELNDDEVAYLWNNGAGNPVLGGGPGPGLQGDLNGDGFVNSADLDLVRGNWGLSVSPGTNGDANDDGFVNSADLDIVRANWGQSLGAAAVPEPGLFGLLAAALGLALWVRRRG